MKQACTIFRKRTKILGCEGLKESDCVRAVAYAVTNQCHYCTRIKECREVGKLELMAISWGSISYESTRLCEIDVNITSSPHIIPTTPGWLHNTPFKPLKFACQWEGCVARFKSLVGRKQHTTAKHCPAGEAAHAHAPVLAPQGPPSPSPAPCRPCHVASHLTVD